MSTHGVMSTVARSAAPVLLLLLSQAVLPVLGPAPSVAAPTARPDTTAVGVWPLVPEPSVVGAFDPPDDPWGAGHRGVDLAGAPGQGVRSALPGRVTYVGRIAGKGVVVVDHGDTRTTYEPVAATVSLGDRVLAGDRIGTLLLPGSHCFPRACLHWGWLRGETYLDPLLLVGAGPVRLLPLWRDEPVTGSARSPRTPPYAAWRPGLARWVASWSLTPAGVLVGRPIAAGPW